MKNRNISDINYEEILLEIWNQTHLPNSTLEGFYNGNEYFWLPTSGLTLQGSTTSSVSNYFLIEAKYEPNNEWGMTFDEYINDLQYVELILIIANEYIDPKNHDNPIQTAINDHYYVMLESQSRTYFDLFVRK